MFQRTLDLTDSQRASLQEARDHDPRPFVRERSAAILKIADGAPPLGGAPWVAPPA